MNVSILIGSRDRFEVLRRCVASIFSQDYPALEIIVLDDNSSRYHLADLLSEEFDDPRLRCLRAEESLGVAAGRNLLLAQATGDIFCFIDDDAIFQDDDAISHLVAAFETHPGVGIIATQVFDHYPSGHIRLYLPFTQRQMKRNPRLVIEPQPISYYLGTCHAIRRQVVTTCGGYQKFTKFGEEELDMSYRAIEAGFSLLYWPPVVVHHFPQPSVVDRRPKHRHAELYYHTRNRFYLAYRYLPWLYVPVYLVIWLGVYGSRAIRWGALREFTDGMWDGLRQIKGLTRTPLSPRSVCYLKQNHGRLWF